MHRSGLSKNMPNIFTGPPNESCYMSADRGMGRFQHFDRDVGPTGFTSWENLKKEFLKSERSEHHCYHTKSSPYEDSIAPSDDGYTQSDDEASTPSEDLDMPCDDESAPCDTDSTPFEPVNTPLDIADIASTPLDIADIASTPLDIADIASTPLDIASTPLDIPSAPLDIASTPCDIPSAPLLPGKTTRKEPKKRAARKCSKALKVEIGTLDSYFLPHTGGIADPAYGVKPNDELIHIYNDQMKAVKFLIGERRKQALADKDGYTDENFSAFEGFLEENDGDDGDNAFNNSTDDDDEVHRDGPSIAPDIDEGGNRDCVQLPELPIDVASSINVDDDVSEPPAAPRPTIPTITSTEMFKRNENLTKVISKWHGSLESKIALSEKRGALNMDTLGATVMSKFTEPQMTFQKLVEGQKRRDVPRFFFACLQLTNEGNIDIVKTNKDVNATDCMSIKQLRTERIKEVDEYNPDVNDSSDDVAGRKRPNGDEQKGPRKGPVQKRRKKD